MSTPPVKKTPVAKAAAKSSTPPKSVRAALVPLELMEAIETFLGKQNFADVEHIMIPIRMGAIKVVSTAPPPDKGATDGQ